MECSTPVEGRSPTRPTALQQDSCKRNGPRGPGRSDAAAVDFAQGVPYDGPYETGARGRKDARQLARGGGARAGGTGAGELYARPEPAAPAAAPAAAQASAAGSAPAPAAPAASPPQQALTLAVPQLGLNYIVPITAIARGYFAEAGLDVQLQPMPSNLTIAAMQRGDLQISGSGGSAIRAAVQGAPFKLVSFMTARPTYYLVTRPELRGPAQLPGARIGVNAIGGTLEFFTEAYARQQGVDASQILFVGMGPNPVQHLAAMQAGALDGAVLDPGSAPLAEKQGLTIMASLGELAPVPQQGMVATDDYIQKNPTGVQAFLKALVRGLQYVKQNHREVVAIARQQLSLDLDDALALRGVQLYADAIWAEAPGYADETLLQAFYEHDVRIPLELPPDEPIPVLHDFRFLLAAYDELGIPRPR
jgi:NitT/TauT family transport system substrate-binding protein